MPGAALKIRLAMVASVIAAATILSSDTGAWMATGAKWNRSSVSYYVNPVNLDLSAAAAEAAVRAGADVWDQQSRASFRFTFGGVSAQTTIANDAANLVVFRSTSNGSPIATTYWWSNSSGIIDADIVFWDAAYRFFSGSSGCSAGHYIEDIAAHEFGHALGLGHSTVSNATMYPSTPSCNPRNRTLEPDDVAGVEALYPPPSAPPAPPRGFRIVPPAGL